MVTGSDLAASLEAIELAKSYPGQCYATVGVHPCSAGEFEGTGRGKVEGGVEGEGAGEVRLMGEKLLEEVERAAWRGIEEGTVVAFGEIGLDFDRLGYCGKEVQMKWFGRQLEVASRVSGNPVRSLLAFYQVRISCFFGSRFYSTLRLHGPQLHLPLFLHSRSPQAHGPFLRLLTPHLPSLPSPPGLVHSFTGTVPEVHSLLDLGFHIGVNGCSLKTAENLDVVKEIPLDRLHLETDGPWCEIRNSSAGAKFLGVSEGKGWKKLRKDKWEEGGMVKGRNEPCEILKVAKVVAGVKGLAVEEVAEAAWRNSIAVFGLGVAL